MINNIIKRIKRLWDNETQENTGVWICQGGRGGKPSHPIEYNNSENCIQCRLPRPGASDEQKPQKDNLLLAALAILNVGSGITTIIGAAQIFPRFLGYSSGAVIQILLFLLVSGSTLKHAPKLKWLTVGSLSILSVYTSFFAYYDTLVGQHRTQKNREQATVAHQKLVREVYAPIKQKSAELESEIKIKRKLLEKEIKGERVSGLSGCGEICDNLKVEIEELEAKLEKLQPTVGKLQPRFEYELENKSPQEIFNADREALVEVPSDCLPEDQKFDCLSQEYEKILNPNSVEFKEFRDRYFDRDTRYRLLEPYHKITKGESAAIAAAILALMVDGFIIALGTGVEIRQRQTLKKVTLQLQGTGSAFLNEFLKAIDYTSLTIDYEILQKKPDGAQYIILLENIRINNKGIKRGDNPKEWKIADDNTCDQLLNWLISERERHLKKETTCTVTAKKLVQQIMNRPQPDPEFYQSSKSPQRRNIIFLLPSQSQGKI